MLEVKQVSKLYGSKLAVDGMTFSLRKGEVLAFIGPNGAGKSTTMRVITGFIPPSSGSVTINGANIEDDPIKAKTALGYLPENAPLYENMTVSSFLAFTAEIRGFRGAEKRDRVDKAIETCFLQPVRQQSIGTLSKGYKHRTCFAQAILHDPELLILDEPTDGLDPNQKREVRNLIKSMGENKAIIISTHILEEVEAVASRVILIDRGKNIFDGTPDEFRGQSVVKGTILVGIHKADRDRTCKRFTDLACIDRCETERSSANESLRFRLHLNATAARHDACHDVLEVIKAENWELTEFNVDQGRLDDVFARLTRPEQEVK